MAQLPGDDGWLVGSEGSIVSVSRPRLDDDECIVSFDARNMQEVGQAQFAIHKSDDLTEEQKSFAHFWCGYFYGKLT